MATGGARSRGDRAAQPAIANDQWQWQWLSYNQLVRFVNAVITVLLGVFIDPWVGVFNSTRSDRSPQRMWIILLLVIVFLAFVFLPILLI